MDFAFTATRFEVAFGATVESCKGIIKELRAFVAQHAFLCTVMVPAVNANHLADHHLLMLNLIHIFLDRTFRQSYCRIGLMLR